MTTAAHPSTPLPRNHHFALFDSMRAVAVLFVLAIHVGTATGVNTNAWYGTLTSRGNIGVAIFFLISGFLLYRPYVVAQLGGRAAPALPVYAKRRALRILPAYWLALTLLAIWPGLTGVFSSEWWAYYGLLTSYDLRWFWTGLPVSWSLSVEVAFYVTLPLLAAALGRLQAGVPARTGIQRQLCALALLGLSAMVGRSLALWAGYRVLTWTLPLLFGWFALGMILAVSSVWLAGRENGFAPTRFVGRHGDLIWGVSLAVLVCASLTPFLPRGMTAVYSLGSHSFEHVLYAVVAFGLLLPAVFGEDQGGLVRKLLSLRWLDGLGRISYGVFLWHHPVMIELMKNFPVAAIPLPPFVSLFLLTLGVTAVIAWASFRFVEQPLMRLRNA